MNTVSIATKRPPKPAPRRLFIRELSKYPQVNYVRIMATLSAIFPQKLKLDDGTADELVVMNTLAIKGTVGQTIDVVLYRVNSYTEFYTHEIVWNVSLQDELFRNVQLSFDGETHLGNVCPEVSTDDIRRIVNRAGGVTIQDLSLVFDITPEHVESCLQELQLEGEIYMNRNGEYVPL